MAKTFVQCPKGHSYDPSVHSTCPECARSSFGNFPSTSAPGYVGGFSSNVGHTQPATGGFGGSADIGKTMPASGAAYNGSYNNRATEAVENFYVPADNNANPAFPHTVIGAPVVQEEAGWTPPEVKQTHPVVGWLVCIEGALKGVDFRLHNGYNYIGREVGDVHIHGDNEISREKHAVISFYAKHGTFHISPSDGRNIIELNGEPVYAPTQVKSYDVITLGNTKLMLIAMCGEHFNWTTGGENG